MTLTHRPCGACKELVDVTEGCRHWKPGKSGFRVGAARSRRPVRHPRKAEIEWEALKKLGLDRLGNNTVE